MATEGQYFDTKTEAVEFVEQNEGWKFRDNGKKVSRTKRWEAYREINSKPEKEKKVSAKKSQKKTTSGTSKMEAAREVFNKMVKEGHSRQEILAAFQDEIGLTPAGSKTYIFKLQKEYGVEFERGSRSGTKAEIGSKIMEEEYPYESYDRQTVLARLMDEASMTKNYAATFIFNWIKQYSENQ